MNAMKRMSTAKAAAAAALAIALAIPALPAWSQAYPSRPIRLIVNFPPGGTGDIIGRIVANQLAIELGQSVVVKNHSGAGGTIGARDVVNAPPDGYTLTVAQTPEIAINPYFMKDVGYDPLKDLQPIALGGVVPLALVVPPNSPYSTAAQWVAALRSGKALTFASAGIGTPGHLAGELLKLKLDNKLVRALQGRRSGLERRGRRTSRFLFSRLSGRRAADARRQDQAACSIDGQALAADTDIPTVAEATGIANFDFTLWAGFLARAACRRISQRGSMPRSTRSFSNRISRRACSKSAPQCRRCRSINSPHSFAPISKGIKPSSRTAI